MTLKQTPKRKRGSSRELEREKAPEREASPPDSSASAALRSRTCKKRKIGDASGGCDGNDADRLSLLPHELILRILHVLPVQSILVCQLLNKKWRRLAGDAQVWKGLYYRRWVRPRALMLRRGGSEAPSAREPLPVFSSRRSKWLDEGRLLGEGEADGERTDWKARYRLRHNWSIGAAEVREIGLGLDCEDGEGGERERESEREDEEGSGLLVRLLGGVVVTVDAREGLRAWDLKGSKCVAQSCLEERTLIGQRSPSCLGLDTASEAKDGSRVVVGFEDGGFWIWRLRLGVDGDGIVESLYSKQGEDRADKRLRAVAYAHPYLLTITDKQLLSLYSLNGGIPVMPEKLEKDNAANIDSDLGTQSNIPVDIGESQTSLTDQTRQARLLTSLKSHTSWPPLSLSIRSTPQSIIASIAYALPTYISGWSVGLQELHLTPSGSVSYSRIASAIEQGFQSLLRSPDPTSPSLSPGRATGGRGRYISSRPTSLSYSHPYLLAGNRDNTLTLYLVTSNNAELKIGKGTQLWGHTSSVAGAQIGGRGKAVSISARGEELRVWELEAGLGKMVGDRSVRVRAGLKDEMANTRPGDIGAKEGRAWVGFDDEVVIVLRDEGEGEKALVVYDFT